MRCLFAFLLATTTTGMSLTSCVADNDATGISMEMGMKALLTKGTPKHIHVACVLAAPQGIEHVKKTFPEDKTTIWCASIDEGLNEHKYIIPGFGDAGDLCYGSKL